MRTYSAILLSALCGGCSNWTGFGFHAEGGALPNEPAIPLTGTDKPAAHAGTVTAIRPLDGNTSGRQARGTSNSAHNSSDHASVAMS